MRLLLIKTLEIHAQIDPSPKIKMSRYIPFEVQQEIIERLPVKPLLQCRSVSKAWKSLIDSSEFITAHRFRHAQPDRLLVSYKDRTGTNNHYVSFVDDHTFPQNNFALTVPMYVELLSDSRIVGTSLGLFCFYGNHKERGHMAVLWNPSIRKSIAIPVPDVLSGSYGAVQGFGVCPETSDPKIVRITQFNTTGRPPQEVEVYSLSSGIWRTISCNLPRQSIEVKRSHAVVDRFIYWTALTMIDGFLINLIISFDMTNEIFGVIELPDDLEFAYDLALSICKLRDSLAVLAYDEYPGPELCFLWKMEHGVQKTFTKLFTIEAPQDGMYTRGFMKNGEPIMQMPYHYKSVFERMAEKQYDHEEFSECLWEMRKAKDDVFLYEPDMPEVLVVYEPNSKCIGYLEGIDVKGCSFVVNSYMETLLLLDQSD